MRVLMTIMMTMMMIFTYRMHGRPQDIFPGKGKWSVEVRRAEAGGVHGDGLRAPFPPARGLGAL